MPVQDRYESLEGGWMKVMKKATSSWSLVALCTRDGWMKLSKVYR